MEVDGAPKKKEKKPPAAPNTSSDCPCAHNDWDNVRVKKGFITLRCRQCQAQWKTETGNVKKCHNFFQGSCTRGAACPSPHIHRYKQSLQKRQAIFGEELDGDPLSSPPASPDSGAKRRRRKKSLSPANSRESSQRGSLASVGDGDFPPAGDYPARGVSPASTPPITPNNRRHKLAGGGSPAQAQVPATHLLQQLQQQQQQVLPQGYMGGAPMLPGGAPFVQGGMQGLPQQYSVPSPDTSQTFMGGHYPLTQPSALADPLAAHQLQNAACVSPTRAVARRGSAQSNVSDASKVSSDPGPERHEYEDDVEGLASSTPLPQAGHQPISPALGDRLAQSFPSYRPGQHPTGLQQEYEPVTTTLPSPGHDPFQVPQQMPMQPLPVLPHAQPVHTLGAPQGQLGYRRSTFGAGPPGGDMPGLESPKSAASTNRVLHAVVNDDGTTDVASNAGDEEDAPGLALGHVVMTEREVDELMKDRASSEGSCAQRYIPTKRAEKQAAADRSMTDPFVFPYAQPLEQQHVDPLTAAMLPSNFGQGRRESYQSNCSGMSSPAPLPLHHPGPGPLPGTGNYSLSPVTQPMAPAGPPPPMTASPPPQVPLPGAPAPLTHLHPTASGAPPSPYYGNAPSPHGHHLSPGLQHLHSPGNVSPCHMPPQPQTQVNVSPMAPMAQQPMPVAGPVSPSMQPTAPPVRQGQYQPYANYGGPAQ